MTGRQIFDERMAAIADLVRERMASNVRPGFQDHVDAVREQFYTDYSQWDAEFDVVERVITRAMAEAQQGSAD